jgi:hypothetical protein
MDIERLRHIVQAYDDGNLTDGEVSGLMLEISLEEYLKHLDESNGAIAHMTGGAFRPPYTHQYGMFDFGPGFKAFYRFSLYNVLRFFWNKLVRKLDWHRLTKVW